MLLVVGGSLVVLRRLDAAPTIAVPPSATQLQVEQWLVAALYHAAALTEDAPLRLSVQTLAAELGGRYPLLATQRFAHWRSRVEACARDFPRSGPGRISVDRAVGLALHLERLLKDGRAC